MNSRIDAAGLKQMILCAAAMIENEKQQINDLNVFPVPDGDTGTNMSLTIATAANELRKASPIGVDKTAEITANALLRGARGNSGVILSLLFRGFSRSLKGKETMDGMDFALAVGEGVDAAYKAVMKPAEGTILTVSRLSAAAAKTAAAENPDPENVLRVTIEAAENALANTTEQNPVLKKAGVIDAGGKGYVTILNGMLAALRGATEESLGANISSSSSEAKTFSSFTDEDITFTYCTEFIITRENRNDPNPLRAFLDSRGDSLVFVEDDEIIKVHVHTDHPGLAIEQALKYGSLLTVKIENMREQHTQKVIGEQAAEQNTRQISEPSKRYGFVSVCAGSGIADVFRDLGVDGIISGGQTMNPSTEDILREIDNTPAEIVYVLPNNKNIIMAAEQCVPLCETKQVIVLPTTSIPEGISAMLAMDHYAEPEQNTKDMTQAIGQVLTAQITYAARDSEFDGQNISQGDYMSLINGKLTQNCKDISQLLRGIAERIVSEGREYITVFYGSDVTQEQAAQTESLLAECCPGAEINVLQGGQPVYYYIISAE